MAWGGENYVIQYDTVGSPKDERGESITRRWEGEAKNLADAVAQATDASYEDDNPDNWWLGLKMVNGKRVKRAESTNQKGETSDEFAKTCAKLRRERERDEK